MRLLLLQPILFVSDSGFFGAPNLWSHICGPPLLPLTLKDPGPLWFDINYTNELPGGTNNLFPSSPVGKTQAVNVTKHGAAAISGQSIGAVNPPPGSSDRTSFPQRVRCCRLQARRHAPSFNSLCYQHSLTWIWNYVLPSATTWVVTWNQALWIFHFVWK